MGVGQGEEVALEGIFQVGDGVDVPDVGREGVPEYGLILVFMLSKVIKMTS